MMHLYCCSMRPCTPVAASLWSWSWFLTASAAPPTEKASDIRAGQRGGKNNVIVPIAKLQPMRNHARKKKRSWVSAAPLSFEPTLLGGNS